MKNMKRRQVDQLRACNQRLIEEYLPNNPNSSVHMEKEMMSILLPAMALYWWCQEGGQPALPEKTRAGGLYGSIAGALSMSFPADALFTFRKRLGRTHLPGSTWVGMGWKCCDIYALLHVHHGQRGAFLMPSKPDGIRVILWLRPPHELLALT